MSESWDFYFARLEGQPASIALDLSLRDTAPIPERPTLIAVRVTMKAPRPDGFMGEGEVPTLTAIERAFADGLLRWLGATQVGRLTSAGKQEYFFYAKDDAALLDALAEVQAAHADYAIGYHAEPDPEWRTYRELLLPGPSEYAWIQDRRVVDALREAGDRHEVPRVVDHHLRVETAEQAEAARVELEKHGFEVKVIAEAAGFQVSARRRESVELHLIHTTATSLRNFAERLGGAYEGWGSPVVFGSASG